jgi:hypothetical protein
LATNQGEKPKQKAAVYFDGFNLYHPIHEMGEPFLKWCNLWKLSELFCIPKDLTLKKVVFCTAVPDHFPEKSNRHNTFNRALASYGVTIIKGHHVFDPTAQKYSEKQSDINVALSVILDGIDDIYDWAFLVSADSDQAATAKFFAERFPEKKLVAVAPPTKDVPQKSLPHVETHFTISKDQIESCVMPELVQGKTGWIRRTVEYKPPIWWMHPDQRPKKK